MAHELDMTNGSAAIAYAGATPWHKLGTRFDDLMTSGQALTGAGLDWTVSKQPAVFYNTAGQTVTIPGAYATVRDDTQAPLGFVGRDYTPIQNTEAFDFMDSILPEGGLKYEVAGALFGGQYVWMLAKMPSSTVVSHDDVTDHYLLFTNTHNGRRAAFVGYTTVRVVCNNTLRIANPKYRFKFRHSGHVMNKLDAARCVLGLANDAFKEFDLQAKTLSFRSTTKMMVQQYKLALFGAKSEDDMTKPAQKSWERIEELAETGAGTELPGVKGTMWGLYNAVSEWQDHYRIKGQSDENRLEDNNYGAGADYKDRAWQLALATI